ncbi:MAG: MMPL family transporter [Vicinamibacterales bacterium]
MSGLVTSIVAAAYRRRALTLILVLAASALFGVAALRVRFDTDVLSLLPRTGTTIPAFRRYVSAFGGIDELFVIFTAPAGRSVEEYGSEIDAWAEALRTSPEIAGVDTGVADPSHNAAWLADRELLLLRGAALDKALERLRPEGMAAALASQRELLALPSSQVADFLRYDPAGLSSVLTESLGPAARALANRFAHGYVSEDGRRRLLIARPTRPPYDTAFSHALDHRLEAIRARIPHEAPQDDDLDDPELPPLEIAFAGGHRIALETEAVVRRESIWNTVGSLALILPLLLVIFRSVWLVLVGPLPSLLSLAFVGGVLGLSGVTLSAAAAGSAAMLFGLGVDGVVLLYVSHRLAAQPGSTDQQRLQAIASPSSSMLLGMWTTAATFYGLAFVDVPSLQQLGLLIGHAMVACGILTLVLVPALLPRSPAPRRVSLTLPRLAAWIAAHRRAILATATGVTVALAVASLTLRVDPTLERLRSVTPAAQLEEQVAPIFGLPRDVYVLLGEGPSLEPLLRADERIAVRLSRDLPRVSAQAASSMLPSAESQSLAAQRIAAADLSEEAVEETLAQSAAQAGFRDGAFAPFVDRLPRLLDTSARVTYEGYLQNGLRDLVRRFVTRDGDRWLVASFVFPTTLDEVEAIARIVADEAPGVVLTGLPMVNRELSAMFLPQFLKGLAIGSVVVLLLVVAAFREWRLSMYALLPTALGLVWAAGVLALLGVELDLFAVFAVVTFIGVGVDYGIHLVHRFQERGDAECATSELAPVILAAAAITLFGYGTLFTSAYPPLRSIGIVSAVSVITLAAASILVLPALLLGRRR